MGYAEAGTHMSESKQGDMARSVMAGTMKE